MGFFFFFFWEIAAREKLAFVVLRRGGKVGVTKPTLQLKRSKMVMKRRAKLAKRPAMWWAGVSFYSLKRSFPKMKIKILNELTLSSANIFGDRSRRPPQLTHPPTHNLFCRFW